MEYPQKSLARGEPEYLCLAQRGEPAALARARELIEDFHYKAILFSGNSGERLAGVPSS
jgi:hypothetical protein